MSCFVLFGNHLLEAYSFLNKLNKGCGPKGGGVCGARSSEVRGASDWDVLFERKFHFQLRKGEE